MNNLMSETQKTLFYILVSFIFSLAMRLIWVYYFGDYAPFHFNHQFMINTNDGYLWAEGARDLLSGTSTNPDAKEYFDRFHQLHDLSPVALAPSELTAFFAKILPFRFETIIFYMPLFLSSLVVVPIILIARALKNLEMGLIAALLASIAWSYYNRTMAGYYDTDMLNIVLPMFLLWSIIWAVQTNKNIYLIFTAVDIFVYRWWYPQSYSLEFAFFGFILIYSLVFDRKNLFNYKLLAIMMFAMINGDLLIRVALVIISYLLFRDKKYNKYVFYLLGASVVLFFISGGFSPIWDKLSIYIFDSDVSMDKNGLGLHYFTVMQTIREAGHIPFATFANRISGHTVTFLLSLVGYIYLLYRHRIMIFSLPLLGLGFLAYIGGLRFTIYAVPVLAFGIAYLITKIASIMPTVKLKYLSMIMLTLAILFPNYRHIEAYKVPTVFSADEVKVLQALGKKASREDYVVAWWDYGYPIRYYCDVKTLIDGGKHTGDVNFPVSYMLTHSQAEAARLARLDVEYNEKAFDYAEDSPRREKSLIENMTVDYGFRDTNDFLKSLKTDIKLPKKTRNIYFYLPFRMINIFPTITRFSSIDLMNGETIRRPFFYQTNRFREQNGVLNLGNRVLFDQKKGTLRIGNQIVPLRAFYVTYYTKNGKLVRQKQILHKNANLSIIYMKSYGTMLILDRDMFNSMYIQLFVFDNYDKKLFEPVILTPSAKVYKLKL